MNEVVVVVVGDEEKCGGCGRDMSGRNEEI